MNPSIIWAKIKDAVLIFFFLPCKDIFLGSKAAYAAFSSLTPSAAHTSSHSAVPVSPSLELPDKPDWELAQVIHAFVVFFL